MVANPAANTQAQALKEQSMASNHLVLAKRCSVKHKHD